MWKKTRGFVFMLQLVYEIYSFSKESKEKVKERKERENVKRNLKIMIARNIPSPSLGLPIRKDPLNFSRNLMET